MRLIERRPWFYRLICLVVGTPPATAIYTYGDTIYAPGSKGHIPPDLWAHEKVHWEQQGRAPWLWWIRWMLSRSFRIDQETAAYRVQLQTFPRSARAYMARQLAGHLSSPMYGHGVGFAKAYEEITRERGTAA